jgi:catechol-2,3-dioxygenase
VHAVSVRVGDLDRAVAWYREHFRCEVVQVDERRALLAFGQTHLQLCRWDDAEPPLTIVSPDVAELGPSSRRADGVRSLQLTDPWGNAIEVVDRA